jgi:hypothetical protein
MNSHPVGFSYRSWAAAVVILVTLVSGGVTPGSKLDRMVFQWMAGVVHDSPVWVDGFGSRDTPWSLRVPTNEDVDVSVHGPALVWVGDDPEGVFQSSPPSPVDYAVMFSNMKRLDVRHAACAVVLAWDAPDAIGLMALESALGQFDSMVMAAPVTRGAVAQPMPQAYRRASLPITVVTGDVNQMPVVNRIPIPDVVLGAERTWAGFSAVESEPDGGYPFLCARWDDRVVFSFAMCAVARRLGVSWESVEIRLGEFIRMGRKGPIIPIDDRGRMKVSPKELAAVWEKPAEGLIDATKGWLPSHVPEPVILADRRGLADAEVRRFSSHLAGSVASIAGEAGLSARQSYARLPGVVEWLLVEAVAFGLAALFWLPRSQASMSLALFLILAAGIQLLGFSLGALWAPGASVLAPLLVSAAAIWWPRLKLALPRGGPDTPASETDR